MMHDVRCQKLISDSKRRSRSAEFAHWTGAFLLREGSFDWGDLIRRKEVRPFTDKQIKLLETFADQAVIAIENVRLFQELERKRATETLEQQTATSEILGVIASSPTDISRFWTRSLRVPHALCAQKTE